MLGDDSDPHGTDASSQALHLLSQALDKVVLLLVLLLSFKTNVLTHSYGLNRETDLEYR